MREGSSFKDFSKIIAPLCRLLAKEVDFVFDQACKDAHDELKRRVTFAPIIQPLIGMDLLR